MKVEIFPVFNPIILQVLRFAVMLLLYQFASLQIIATLVTTTL
jgi:hypothetical protein